MERAMTTPHPKHGAPLCRRELDVTRLGASGLTNQEIATQLWVSEDTVKTHFYRALKKTGARNRAHLVAIALSQNLIAPVEAPHTCLEAVK